MSLTTSTMSGARTWRTERLTDNDNAGMARCHCTSWAHAISSTQAPIGTMSPVSSANGMKSSGPTSPMSGRSQRTRASTPAMVPLREIDDRLIVDR